MTEENQSLGKRINNPLNIRYSPSNNWRGSEGVECGFVKFKNMAYGFRAAFITLTNYIKNGHNTLESIIRRWAPPCENNTENYISFVEKETLIPRDLELTDISIHDYWTKIIIIQAMAIMESGTKVDEQQINLYINYPEKF